MSILCFSDTRCFAIPVFGCSDPKLPNYAWYKREGDVATIGCTGASERWQLVCEGSTWKGSMGTCKEGEFKNQGALTVHGREAWALVRKVRLGTRGHWQYMEWKHGLL